MNYILLMVIYFHFITAPASNRYNFFVKTDTLHGTFSHRNIANCVVGAMGGGLRAPDV